MSGPADARSVFLSRKTTTTDPEDAMKTRHDTTIVVIVVTVDIETEALSPARPTAYHGTTTTKEHAMTTSYRDQVRCAICGRKMTFLEWADHVHPEPAPELLAVLRASTPPRLAFQPNLDDRPDFVDEVVEYDPFGRGGSEVVVRYADGREGRTSTRYLRVV